MGKAAVKWECRRAKRHRVREKRRLRRAKRRRSILLCGTTVIAMTSEGEDQAASAPRKRLSCTTCFNNLWFCYSPVHQMQQYYRLGVLDNCADKWSSLIDCLHLKTKRSSEVQEILENREKAKPHIWTFRTTEESSSHWKEIFGHLDDME